MHLKVLWIARTCPFPVNDGEKLRVYNLLKALAERHEITVVYREIDSEDAAGAAELRRFCKAVYGVHVPRPKGFLGKLRWLLPFAFSRYPISLCTVFFWPIAEVLARLSSTERFDIVQVEHSSLTIYLDHVQFEGAATLLTMHNIDYVRNERVLRNTNASLTKAYHFLNQLRFRDWELNALQRYDHVIAMSNIDREILLKDSPGLVVTVVPNGVDASAVNYQPVDATARTLVFVASMDSEANHDGAMYFLREVWPLLRPRERGLTVKMVGRAPNQELLAAGNGDDVVVTGKVGAVLHFYREALMAIVPLRSGGGTRLKILEAMAAGTPVVSTTVGCEGLDVVPDRSILVADEPSSFAAAIARILDEPELAASLSREGRQLVEERYDWALIADQHDAAYQLTIQGASKA